MNGVEAAASLFGSDDFSSDPFASLEGDGTTPSAFSDYGPPAPQAEEQPLPVQRSIPNEAQPITSGESTLHHYTPMQQYYSSFGGSGVVGQQETPNWYGHTNVSTQQDHSANPNYWSAYSTGLEPSRAPAPSQNTYDPYTPPTMNDTYTSAYTPSTTADYSPYRTTAVPPTRPFVSQPNLSYSTPTSYTTSGSTASFPLPPAPVPTTTITRPKISNAYDPPFPPTTKSKRVLLRSGPSQNTGYGPYQVGNTHSHQQPHLVAVPKSETQPYRGMARQEYGDYSSEPILSVKEIGHQNFPHQGHRTVDKPHYFMDESPVGVEDCKNEYSVGMSSRPEIDLENVTGFQANERRFQTSPTALVSSNLGAITRTSSPEIVVNYQPLVPSPALTQLPSKVEPVINGSEATNSVSVHNGLRSPKPTVSPSNVSQIHSPTSPDPCGPPKGNRYAVGERRAASPGSQSTWSINGRQSTKPHPVGRPLSKVEDLRGRSVPNGAVLGSTYHENPYAPQLYQKPSEVGPIPQAVPHASPPNYSAYESSAALREVPMKSQSQYAPSPSLVGSNDPLGRTSARAPVINFGFGGKLVTCFHGLNTLSTGFDVALSSRRTTYVQIHNLVKVVPRSTLDIPATSFPGPLFSDPGITSSSLVRAGASNQKNKKAGVIKYLTERAEEISHGLGYLTPDSMERRQAEGKLVLIKLLRIMVENDGRLSGSALIDASIRSVLIPRLDGNLTAEFTTMIDTHVIRPDASSIVDPETVVAVSTLRSSCLDKIQEYLLRGERRQAYHYALDEKLWAHAMVIASSIDKEAWKEVVNEFLKAELAVKDGNTYGHLYSKNTDLSAPSTNGREALRMVYSLFSGRGSAAIQELVPPSVLGHEMTKLQVQNAAHVHVTPRTPNFHPPAPPANIPLETLTKWTELVAMMISSTISPDTSSALTALGDQLLVNQYIEAAHVCYLLAPQTSLMGGLGNPAVRIVLVGSKTPAVVPNFAVNPDSIVFSEIVEFALSLSPTTKTQEVFAGLPHLQAYRFIRAVSLAEVGEIQLANSYCEAITASLGRPSPYFTPVFLEQLKGLTDRISGTSHVDKSSSWMGSKIGKPSLDSIGGWLEGRFTKLVTGDADSPTQAQDMEERTFSGPFSSISTTPSARSSPQPASVNVTPVPPPRSGSAIASSSHSSYVPVDRASSALDYHKPKAASAPRVASAGASITSFSQLATTGPNQPNPSADSSMLKKANDENQESVWWGGSSSHIYNDSSSTKTPTAASFMRVDESTVTTTQEGFISLMDAPTFPLTTSSTTRDSPNQRPVIEEDIEDLGFGNTRKLTGDGDASARGSPQPTELQKSAQPEKIESKAPASSWLSRWWKREPTSGAVKASLGEESSFYYDKDLKRWVNKEVGSEDTANKSVVPPPPSRAQTASPGMTGPRLKPTNTQIHSTSTIDLSTSPPSKSTLRVRSNLAPPALDSAPSSPTGTRPGASGPPPGRPKSQTTSRRNIRSRYVDVLQSEGGRA